MRHAKASFLPWTVALWMTFIHGALSAERAGSGPPEGSDRRAAWRPDAAFVQMTGGESTTTLNAGLQWNTRRRWMLAARLQAELFTEVCVGRWHATPNDATQLTIAPSIRLQGRDSRWYVDAGVGPSWIGPAFTHGDKTFSTTFNFRTHLATGYRMGHKRQHDLSVRIEHFSNAGIEEPNPGLNLGGVRYTRRF